MFRTRFRQQIVAEFLPPARRPKQDKVIVLCDGMPSIPRKQALAEFLAGKGYWVIYPRYRGAWESGGEFLARSPHHDILDVISDLPKGMTELAFGQRFSLAPEKIFVIGGSFGGAASLLCSLDRRVDRVIANCPVVDWAILAEAEEVETSNPSYASYIRQAFGQAYRVSDQNWKKLYSGKFYNPAFHVQQMDAAKIMMFHAKDDPSVPSRSVEQFAKATGARLKLLAKGGHISTDLTVRKYWTQIRRFLETGR